MNFSYILDLGNPEHIIIISSGDFELPTSTGWSSYKTADFQGTLKIDGVQYENVYFQYSFYKDDAILPHILAHQDHQRGDFLAEMNFDFLIKPEINGEDQIFHGTVSKLSLPRDK